MIDEYLTKLYQGVDKNASRYYIKMYIRMLEKYILSENGEALDFIQQDFINKQIEDF
jgi:hypothetical protein